MVSLLFSVKFKSTQFHFKVYKINNRDTSGNIPDCKRSFTFLLFPGGGCIVLRGPAIGQCVKWTKQAPVSTLI